MNSRTIQYMSIGLFLMLLLWGGYTLLVYLGVPYHGAALMTDGAQQGVTVSCDATAFLCRGIATLWPAVMHTIGRAAPFAGYAIISLLCFAAYAGWQAISANRKTIAIRWTPWKLLLLCIASVWLLATTLSFGTVNGAPVRFYPEPSNDTYNVSEPALASLQVDYHNLLDRNCLSLQGQSQAGANLYTLRMSCIQSAFVTRVLAQVLFVLTLLFAFLILGRMVLRTSSRRFRGEYSGFHSLMHEALVCTGAGACVLIVLLWCLAVAGLYVTAAGWILAALIPIVGFPHAKYWLEHFLFRTWEREYRWQDPTLLLGWLLITYLALNFLEVVRPFPIGWDDLGSYLNRPRLLVSYGHFIASMSPFDWSYITSLGYLLFGYNSPVGSTASMMVNWSAGLLAVAAIFTVARTYLGKQAGFLSALLYSALPLIGHFSFADMKIDNAIFFFSALAMLMMLLALTPPSDTDTSEHHSQSPSALLRAGSIRHPQFVFLSGLFIGFAFATKVTAAMPLFALAAMLAGLAVHPLAFAGGVFLTFAALAKKHLFSIDTIIIRVTGAEPSTDLSMVCFVVLAMIGLVCIAAPFVRKRHTLVPTVRLAGLFAAGVALAIVPWIAHNNIESGRVIPRLEFAAPNRLSPNVDITTLPPELAVDLKNPVCTPSGSKEELDRYWGFRQGWAHYLTLPWRTVMNIDSTGYYVTTLPVLLLFPLLLLLPYFWKKEGRWLRWLSLATFMMLLQWMFVANGIPWYGVSMLLGLVIGLEALVAKAPDRPNRIAAWTLIVFSLVIAFGMRFWQFEQQRNIFEYSMGKVSADSMREITIPWYGAISQTVTERHALFPDRPYLYRVGTFIAYFIPRNLEVIGISDHQLDVFNCLYQERNPELTVKRFKALGFNSIVFDTNTATIERDEQGSLHAKVNAFVNFANDPKSGLKIVVSDENAGIAYILIP